MEVRSFFDISFLRVIKRDFLILLIAGMTPVSTGYSRSRDNKQVSSFERCYKFESIL